MATAKCIACDVIVDELLHFIQDNLVYVDNIESLIIFVVENYSASIIKKSQALLLSLLFTAVVMPPVGDEGTAYRDVAYMIEVLQAAEPDEIPVFVTKDLTKIPLISFGCLDVSWRVDKITDLPYGVADDHSKNTERAPSPGSMYLTDEATGNNSEAVLDGTKAHSSKAPMNGETSREPDVSLNGAASHDSETNGVNSHNSEIITNGIISHNSKHVRNAATSHASGNIISLPQKVEIMDRVNKLIRDLASFLESADVTIAMCDSREQNAQFTAEELKNYLNETLDAINKTPTKRCAAYLLQQGLIFVKQHREYTRNPQAATSMNADFLRIISDCKPKGAFKRYLGWYGDSPSQCEEADFEKRNRNSQAANTQTDIANTTPSERATAELIDYIELFNEDDYYDEDVYESEESDCGEVSEQVVINTYRNLAAIYKEREEANEDKELESKISDQNISNIPAEPSQRIVTKQLHEETSIKLVGDYKNTEPSQCEPNKQHQEDTLLKDLNHQNEIPEPTINEQSICNGITEPSKCVANEHQEDKVDNNLKIQNKIPEQLVSDIEGPESMSSEQAICGVIAKSTQCVENEKQRVEATKDMEQSEPLSCADNTSDVIIEPSQCFENEEVKKEDYIKDLEVHNTTPEAMVSEHGNARRDAITESTDCVTGLVQEEHLSDSNICNKETDLGISDQSLFEDITELSIKKENFVKDLDVYRNIPEAIICEQNNCDTITESPQCNIQNKDVDTTKGFYENFSRELRTLDASSINHNTGNGKIQLFQCIPNEQHLIVDFSKDLAEYFKNLLPSLSNQNISSEITKLSLPVRNGQLPEVAVVIDFGDKLKFSMAPDQNVGFTNLSQCIANNQLLEVSSTKDLKEIVKGAEPSILLQSNPETTESCLSIANEQLEEIDLEVQNVKPEPTVIEQNICDGITKAPECVANEHQELAYTKDLAGFANISPCVSHNQLLELSSKKDLKEIVKGAEPSIVLQSTAEAYDPTLNFANGQLQEVDLIERNVKPDPTVIEQNICDAITAPSQCVANEEYQEVANTKDSAENLKDPKASFLPHPVSQSTVGAISESCQSLANEQLQEVDLDFNVTEPPQCVLNKQHQEATNTTDLCNYIKSVASVRDQNIGDEMMKPSQFVTNGQIEESHVNNDMIVDTVSEQNDCGAAAASCIVNKQVLESISMKHLKELNKNTDAKINASKTKSYRCITAKRLPHRGLKSDLEEILNNLKVITDRRFTFDVISEYQSTDDEEYFDEFINNPESDPMIGEQWDSNPTMEPNQRIANEQQRETEVNDDKSVQRKNICDAKKASYCVRNKHLKQLNKNKATTSRQDVCRGITEASQSVNELREKVDTTIDFQEILRASIPSANSQDSCNEKNTSDKQLQEPGVNEQHRKIAFRNDLARDLAASNSDRNICGGIGKPSKPIPNKLEKTFENLLEKFHNNTTNDLGACVERAKSCVANNQPLGVDFTKDLANNCRTWAQFPNHRNGCTDFTKICPYDKNKQHQRVPATKDVGENLKSAEASTSHHNNCIGMIDLSELAKKQLQQKGIMKNLGENVKRLVTTSGLQNISNGMRRPTPCVGNNQLRVDSTKDLKKKVKQPVPSTSFQNSCNVNAKPSRPVTTKQDVKEIPNEQLNCDEKKKKSKSSKKRKAKRAKKRELEMSRMNGLTDSADANKQNANSTGEVATLQVNNKELKGKTAKESNAPVGSQQISGPTGSNASGFTSKDPKQVCNGPTESDSCSKPARQYRFQEWGTGNRGYSFPVKEKPRPLNYVEPTVSPALVIARNYRNGKVIMSRSRYDYFEDLVSPERNDSLNVRRMIGRPYGSWACPVSNSVKPSTSKNQDVDSQKSSSKPDKCDKNQGVTNGTSTRAPVKRNTCNEKVILPKPIIYCLNEEEVKNGPSVLVPVITATLIKENTNNGKVILPKPLTYNTYQELAKIVGTNVPVNAKLTNNGTIGDKASCPVTKAVKPTTSKVKYLFNSQTYSILQRKPLYIPHVSRHATKIKKSILDTFAPVPTNPPRRSYIPENAETDSINTEPNTGRISNENGKLRAADEKISIVITNVKSENTELDIAEYICNKTNITVSVRKLNVVKEYDNAYKLFVPHNKLYMFLDVKFWPTGIVFKLNEYYNDNWIFDFEVKNGFRNNF